MVLGIGKYASVWTDTTLYTLVIFLINLIVSHSKDKMAVFPEINASALL